VLTNQYNAVLAPSGRQIGLIVAASKIRLAMIIRAENNVPACPQMDQADSQMNGFVRT